MNVEILDDKFSFGHIALGALTYFAHWLFIVFLFYEIIEFIWKYGHDKKEKPANFIGDLMEYFLGLGMIQILIWSIHLSP